MNIFEILLEIKTGKKNLYQRAIYIKKSLNKWKSWWKCFTYYYDEGKHSFYINGFTQSWAKNKKDIQEVINRAYKREQNAIRIDSSSETNDFMKSNKKPTAFYFYKSDDTQFICIDKINLKVIRNSKLEIKELIIWAIELSS